MITNRIEKSVGATLKTIFFSTSFKIKTRGKRLLESFLIKGKSQFI